jgi:tetratricopeptide (TPR) repeat protein
VKISLITGIFFLTSICFSQNKDSLQIEKEFLSSIGNINKIDSLRNKIFEKSKKNFVLEDTYWYNLSKALFLSGEIDEAFSAAEKGIVLCEKQKKTYREAKFYNLQASVYAFRKENRKAIATFKKALSIVEKENDFKTAASIRNNIANIFFGLSDYASAHKYSLLAYNQLVKDEDTVNLPGVTGVLAISSLKIGNSKEGIRLANKSIFLAKKYKSPIGLIVGYHSLGEALSEQNEYEQAITSLHESLKYSEMYRQSHFVMLNKVALQHAYLMNLDYTNSIDFGLQAKAETQQLKNENTLYAIDKNLAYAYQKMGNTDLAFQYLSEAHESYIASSGIQNQKAINDILIKYDTEKKEKDLVLSRFENIENQNKLYKRAQWIILLGVVLGLVLLSYFFYNRLQKQRLAHLKNEQESKRLIAPLMRKKRSANVFRMNCTMAWLLQ